MISIAILGHGVVGSGVAEIVTTHKNKLFSHIGEEVHIKKILDLRTFPENPLADRFTTDFEEILNDIEIRIVVECMGGTVPAYEYVKKCLLAGKSVATSNKELVAAYGAELLAIAKSTNTNFLFEASVGGGIPIIRPISQCLVANIVNEVAGILNGTTNFILTKMFDDGMDFETALKLAQELGFAERNPAADVEGYDACRKICILASLTFNRHVYPEWVHTEGITSITLRDVEYAQAWGGSLKLIGRAKRLDNGKIDIVVAPMLVPGSSQLANIKGEFNGIMVRGDCTGDVVFYGKGAGKLATASAVVADVIDCCKHLKSRKYLFWPDGDRTNIIDYRESVFAYFILLKTKDRTSAILQAQDAFGSINIIEKLGADPEELAFTTLPMRLCDAESKLEALQAQGEIVLSLIRIGEI